MAPKLRTIGPLIGRFDGRIAKTPPKEADSELGTSAHREWRLIVCRRAGWRCQWIEPDGSRCPRHAPERMIADHIVEREDGGALYDPDNGQCLCVAHNTLKGIKARQRRAGG